MRPKVLRQRLGMTRPWLRSALDLLEARAQFEAPERTVHIRVAEHSPLAFPMQTQRRLLPLAKGEAFRIPTRSFCARCTPWTPAGRQCVA